MLSHYKKLVKRKFRESKLVYKKNKVFLVGVSSLTFDFVFKVLQEVNYKNNIQLDVNVVRYYCLEDIEVVNTNTLLVLPSEVIVTIFLANMIENYGYLEFLHEKSDKFFNVGFYLSETWLSKIYNKEKSYFTRDWRALEDFVSELFLLNKKFHKSSANLIKHLLSQGFFAKKT